MNNSLLDQSVTAAVTATNSHDVGIKLLEIAGFFLIPYLPDIINRLIDIPEKLMSNGYECNVKVGNTEVKFGKNLFNQTV